MQTAYDMINSSLNKIYDDALKIETNQDYAKFLESFNKNSSVINETSNIMKKQRKNYLFDSKMRILDEKIKSSLLFIKEKNIEQEKSYNTNYNKEAILTNLDKNMPEINTRIHQLKEIEEEKFAKNPEIDIKDEEYFKNDIDNFLRFNTIYKVFIDKETGEVFISNKLGKDDKELESLEDIQNTISNDHLNPDYNYLENYMYTSTYQDIAVQLNKEINRKIDEPVLQKTTVEKYKEFDENISEEVKDYLEKD